MHICSKCETVKDHTELPTREEYYPFGNGRASRSVIDLECSCGGEYEEAYQCDRCGEWKLPDDIFGYNHCVCKDCLDELYSTENVLEIAKKDDTCESVSLNSLLLWIFPKDEIERILFRELKNSFNDQKTRKFINDWAHEDEDFLSDELYEMEKKDEI